ncbi:MULTISPECIES: hypothetical protein [Haloferax]|uniref:CARDB domain-containing protein n=2 Tax=Haloferax TaxID=2251 RepID=A0A6G1Z6T9_9EURY|nr:MULTISPECIES: hypothetical protein [Haloferax]KAB1185089.1 hypothetical protein Hfx1149_16330 [Haloferax sp. CBA1149]MRW82266.1 hypothetical protein [Haloferax marinisediminis]
MSLRGTALTLAAVTMLLLTSVGSVTAVPDARITVSDATVTPTTPVVGEQVVVTVTIANSVGSPSAAEIEEVELTDPVDDSRVRARRLGGLSPGDSVTVPLALTFETSGPRRLALTVTGTDEDGDTVRIERPVPIAVEDAPPLVDVRIDDAVVDAETRIEVSLSNPTTADMRNIVVSVPGFEGETPVGTASVATLPAGATEIRNLTVVPGEAGETTVELGVDYTTASGTERTLNLDVPVRVSEFGDDVQLTLRPVQEGDDAAAAPDIVSLLAGGGGAGAALGGGVTDGADDETGESATSFDVVVTNFGSAPVTDVVVEPIGPTAALPRLSVPGPIQPGESGTATLDLSEVRESGPLTLRATYRTGVQSGETSTTIDYRPAVADLVFTDLDVTVVDGELRVLGNVANQGRGDAEGVVVELVETDTVAPAYPQRDYFVGRITPSDFAPFELTGTVTDDATDVTVTVRYTVDGAEVVREAVFDLPDDGQSGGFTVGSVAGGGASSAAAAGAAGESNGGIDPGRLLSNVDPTTRSVVVIALVTLVALPVAAAIRIRRDSR